MNQPKVSVVFHGASGGLQRPAKEVAAGAEEEGADALTGPPDGDC